MKYSFDGISMDELRHDIQDEFDCIFDNGTDRTVYLSKETYNQDEDDPEYNFNYKYFIVKDLVDYDGDNDGKKVWISIEIIPTIDSIHPDKLKEMAESSGIQPEDITYEDIHFDADGSVCLSYDKVPIESYDDWEDPEVEEKLKVAANCVSTINSLRGFYLDKPQNLIGLTGWDYLYQLTRNEKYIDQLNKRLAEIKEEQDA